MKKQKQSNSILLGNVRYEWWINTQLLGSIKTK
jgi:hypothetical protein